MSRQRSDYESILSKFPTENIHRCDSRFNCYLNFVPSDRSFLSFYLFDSGIFRFRSFRSRLRAISMIIASMIIPSYCRIYLIVALFPRYRVVRTFDLKLVRAVPRKISSGMLTKLLTYYARNKYLCVFLYKSLYVYIYF